MPGFPVAATTIEGWINGNDQSSIRSHAWALWAGIAAAPFNHNAMCTAYSMTVNPVNSPSGTNVLCYNPYLETGLSGVDGVHSNCMSCHAIAADGNNPNNIGTPPNTPDYPAKFNAPNAYISAVPADDATYYNCNTTTDFAWFLAGNVAGSVQTQPPQPPCATARPAPPRR
jgi:hypothetical protein